MKIIKDKEIEILDISPLKCIQWVREAFLIKANTILPPKISIHPQGSDFINTMLCLLPEKYHTFGCKIVSRISGTSPSLKSNMLIVKSSTGEFEALMKCDWITAMRTGAVATLAIETLKKSQSRIYSFLGLGVIGKATLKCLLSVIDKDDVTIQFLRYKDHAEKLKSDLSKEYPDINFEIIDDIRSLVANSDVVVSCISYTDGILLDNDSLFKPGVLVVPVHTRGFQNCDKTFDKVIADDESHVKGFRFFDQFKWFGELGDVLSGKIKGRTHDSERILSYNIGLGLHDIYYGYNILKMIEFKNPPNFILTHCKSNILTAA